jgi:hypothetical protein
MVERMLLPGQGKGARVKGTAATLCSITSGQRVSDGSIEAAEHIHEASVGNRNRSVADVLHGKAFTSEK